MFKYMGCCWGAGFGPRKTEAQALLEAVIFADQLNESDLCFESDCECLVKMLNDIDVSEDPDILFCCKDIQEVTTRNYRVQFRPGTQIRQRILRLNVVFLQVLSLIMLVPCVSLM
uniref:RNase H type-1 domain-containing protein n=1 Tax=Nelumbo nucifera TaxID=4432 RepID=A0A822YK67_NELNU|nr:TPA_asm: hypothetical protein HUJ06_005224 [Nelumbo nucifera]